MSGPLPIELGWPVQANTGWGLFGLHLALGLARSGRRVHLPVSDTKGIPATLKPTIEQMMAPANPNERRIRFDTWGNHCPAFQPLQNRYRVLLAVFEDTEAIVPETMQRYDLVLAPSRWIQELLAAKGVPSTLWHQGMNSGLFHPAPRSRARDDGRWLIFSGGKLEFRKANDVVVAAFRELLQSPEGDGAVLVTAYHNPWPMTMQGIWEMGYTKGVPVLRNGSLDITSWAVANGIPRERIIDLGSLSQCEMAEAIRECDCAIFPNRCEGATNLVLTETLALGVPAIVGDWTGQADVVDAVPCRHALTDGGPVTVTNDLYRGMAGWREPSLEECVRALKSLRNANGRELTSECAIRSFSWSSQTARLNALLTEVADGT